MPEIQIPYDPTTPLGQVRLLIDDTDTSKSVFSDAEINTFLTMRNGSVRRAAAQALLMVAGSEARLAKKITSQDLQTDGPAVAAELRQLAKQLEAQEDGDEARAGGSAFEIVEHPYAASSWPELTVKPTW